MPPIEVWGPWAFGSGGLVIAIFTGVGKFFSFMQGRSASTAISQQSLIDGLKELHREREDWSAIQIAKLEARVVVLEAKLADREAENDTLRVAIQRLSDSLLTLSEPSGSTRENGMN